MNQDIKKAILKNCGGMETATDLQLMTVWISLDVDTQLKYMASVKKEKEDASAIEANQEFDVILESDKSKDNPPKFVFKALSCRDWRKLAKMADSISVSSTDDAIDTIFSMIKIGLVDWDLCDSKGSKIDFNPDKLEDIVTLSEANELLEKFKNQGIGATERKN